MKRIFFLIVFCFGLATISNAQSTTAKLKSEIKTDKEMGKSGKSDKETARKELRKLQGNEVSYNSIQAFKAMFPKATLVNSERLINFDEFDFTNGDKKTSAYFDDNSVLVATTQQRTYMDLPANAREFIASKYKGYNPINVLFLKDNELNDADMILYLTELDPVDAYFVELSNGFKAIVLQVDPNGEVSYFTRVF